MANDEKKELVAEYKLSDEFREEDQGQNLPKFRVIEKTIPQTYIFSFQDIHTMIATFKKELKSIEVERKDLDRKEQRAKSQLELWETELKVVSEKFPELLEGEPQPSPYLDKKDEGGEPEETA